MTFLVFSAFWPTVDPFLTFERVIFGHFWGLKNRILDFSKVVLELFRNCLGIVFGLRNIVFYFPNLREIETRREIRNIGCSGGAYQYYTKVQRVELSMYKNWETSSNYLIIYLCFRFDIGKRLIKKKHLHSIISLRYLMKKHEDF